MTDMPLIAKVTDDDFLAFLRDQENELWEVGDANFGEWQGSPMDVDELFSAILDHRGGEEEKFIYVFHPFEDASESVKPDVDWKTIPVITKSQLSSYYDSSGFRASASRNAFMFECSSAGASLGEPINLYPVIDPDAE